MPTEGVTGLDEAIRKLEYFADGLESIERKALKAAGDYIAPHLIAATPISTYVPTPRGTSLKPGTLKASVRVRVGRSKKTGKLEAVIGFGKYSWIAWCVEKGHRPPHSRTADRLNVKVTGRNTPGHPFIQQVEDSNLAGAMEVFTKVFNEETSKIFGGS